ncbi:MAG: class I SAM-dependent methyltransferase [Myxococcota bacterium]
MHSRIHTVMLRRAACLALASTIWSSGCVEDQKADSRCVLDGQTFRTDVKSRWRDYTLTTLNRAPRENLVAGLRLLSAGAKKAEARSALDLGAGAGNETRHLLAEGFRVHAIDADPFAVAVMEECARQQGLAARLTTQQATFETMTLPEASYDLVNASYALPFARPETFPKVWTRVVESLTEGGVVTAHFFGPEHGWAENPKMTFFSEAELRALLAQHPLEVRFFEETNAVVETATEDPTRFHVFEVHAVRRSP